MKPTAEPTYEPSPQPSFSGQRSGPKKAADAKKTLLEIDKVAHFILKCMNYFFDHFTIYRMVQGQLTKESYSLR